MSFSSQVSILVKENNDVYIHNKKSISICGDVDCIK